MIRGKVFIDLDGLDEDLVDLYLGLTSARNWRWRGGRYNFCGTTILFGLLEIFRCGGKIFGDMFAHELGRESGPHGEVPSVDVFFPSQYDRTEGSAVQELH